MSNPEFIIIAGPNGAGKTTTISKTIAEKEIFYINPDEIYKGLAIGKLKPNHLHIKAGKIAIEMANDYINKQQSLLMETTLSGISHKKLIEKAKQQGFIVKMVYIYLNSSDISIQRVAHRVKEGGHNIPTETIIRRYNRSLENLNNFYIDIVDELLILDNSKNDLTDNGNKLLRIYEKNDSIEQIYDMNMWQSIKETK